MAMLADDDGFGLTDEQRKQWCLLSVSTDGHPTYGCPGCWQHEVIVERGAELPRTCSTCSKPLTRPSVTFRLAVALMVQGGHRDLLVGEKESASHDNAARI